MTITPAPKPEPTEKKARKPLRTKTPLRSQTPIKTVNVAATAKRKKRHAKVWRSAASQLVKDAAMQRAGGRCEHVTVVGEWEHRCRETDRLEHHHLRYPKTRPLAATDLRVLCRKHHELEEMTSYSYRHRRAG